MENKMRRANYSIWMLCLREGHKEQGPAEKGGDVFAWSWAH